MRNSTDYIIRNEDIVFDGTLSKFTITMKVNESNRYYCAARMQIAGETKSVRSGGTLIIVVNDAAQNVSVNLQLLFLALLLLVYNYVGI